MNKYHLFKINITKLNIISILILVFTIIFTYLLFPSSMKDIILLFDDIRMCILLLPLMIFYFSLHELFHALGYIINGANPKKITFGMELEKSVFYCLCKDNVTRTNILFSLMYPLFFIGIVTYILGIIFNSPMLTLLSILNISGASGDILYFLFIIRLDKDILFSELDDGTSFAIISKKDPSKYNHYGLDYVGVVDSIPRNDFKILKISKLSLVVLIISIIAIVFGMFI